MTGLTNVWLGQCLVEVMSARPLLWPLGYCLVGLLSCWATIHRANVWWNCCLLDYCPLRLLPVHDVSSEKYPSGFYPFGLLFGSLFSHIHRRTIIRKRKASPALFWKLKKVPWFWKKKVLIVSTFELNFPFKM